MRKARIYHHVMKPTSGLNYALGSTMLESTYLSDCKNVRADIGELLKMPGYVNFAGTEASPLTGEIVRLVFLNNRLFAHTHSHLYLYNTTSGVFDDITRVASNYGGGEDDFISYAYINSLLVFTNGIDEVQSWDFTAANAIDLSGATNYIAKWLITIGGRLNLYNLVDTGTDRFLRVRWSVIGDPTDWSGSGSGFVDIPEGLAPGDSIQRAEKLGNFAVVYGVDSFCLQEYLGYVENPFSFVTRVPNHGLVARRALVNIFGKQHFFLDETDVCIYAGGREVQGVGKVIRKELFNIINNENIGRSYMIHLFRQNKIRLFVPTGTSDVCDVFFELNLDTQSWVRGSSMFTGCGSFKRYDAVDWDHTPGNWNSHTGTWTSAANRTESTIELYGDAAGKVYEDTGESANAAGAAVDSWFDTKDFTAEKFYREGRIIWYELQLEAKGIQIDVYYSTNEGTSYTLLREVELTGDWRSYRVQFALPSNVIRFRFKNSSVDSFFELRQFAVGFVKASDAGVVQE